MYDYDSPWDGADIDIRKHRPGVLHWPSPARFALVLGIGVIAVLAAGGVFYWAERIPLGKEHIDGQRDPAWDKRAKEIAKQVEAILAADPVVDHKSPHTVSEVEKNEKPKQDAFRIAEDHRIYDLRKWKPVSPADDPHTAAVTMTRNLRLSKIKPVDRMDFLGRTSGADIVMRCDTPNPEKALLYKSLTKPKSDGREMTEYRLSVDVSNIPLDKEFALKTHTTFWNSLQSPDEQWFGTIGSDGSTILSLLILFPESRPFAGGELQSVQPDGTRVPYEGPRLVFPGPKNAWVYWEVPGPQPGYSYRIDWKWDGEK